MGCHGLRISCERAVQSALFPASAAGRAFLFPRVK
jgi:hypothetical protein